MPQIQLQLRGKGLKFDGMHLRIQGLKILPNFNGFYWTKTTNKSHRVYRVKTSGDSSFAFFFKYTILSNSDTMALGELIEESKGKITGERVLDVRTPKVNLPSQWGETIGESHAQTLGLIRLC